ncbi:hypothetical protein ACQ4PT_024497 [Festuca glaucescens]
MSTEALLGVGADVGGTATSRRVSIDDALTQHAGEFGRWQLRHFVLVTAAWALEALHTMVIIFADREPAMRCPAGEGRCGDRCAGATAGWEWVRGSASSTVAEWGLVCGERYKVGLAQAIFFAGGMVGAGVFGHLSDSFLGRKGALLVACILNAVFGLLTAVAPNYWVYVALRLITGFSTGSVGLCSFVLANEPIGPSLRGMASMFTFYFFSGGEEFLGRKGALLVACILNAVFGLLTAVAPNYWVYVALRLITGFSTGNVGLCSFVLANEPIGPSHRGMASMFTFYFFSGGIAILAGIAALFQSSWRALYVVTSLPSLVYVLAVLPFVSESPRWYLVRRRAEDALHVLQDIATANGRRIPDGVTLKLDN